MHLRFDSNPASVGDTPLVTMLRTLDFIFSITGAQICSKSAPAPTSTPRKTVPGSIGDVAHVQVYFHQCLPHAFLETVEGRPPQSGTQKHLPGSQG